MQLDPQKEQYMANDYFTNSGYPTFNANGDSASARAEFALVTSGFDKLPSLAGFALRLVRVNAAGTALESVTTATAKLIASDGSGIVTANIPLGGFKITGLAAATANGDAVRFEQVGTLAASQITTADISELTNLYYTEARVSANTDVAANKAHAATVTGNPHAVTKADVGLGNVDNTSDVNKPVSTAQQTALDAKIAETSATGSAIIPAGTTPQRDGTPAVGYQRWNTTLGSMEVWDGAAWSALGGGGKILQVVGKTITTQGSQTLALAVDTQVGAGTDFILDIIPKATGSSFLVEYRWFGETSGTWDIVFNVHRDGVRVNNTGLIKAGLSMATQTYGVALDDVDTPEILHLRTLDKSGSTAGISIQFKLVASATFVASTMWTNRCFTNVANAEHGVSEVIITEIAA